MKINDNVVKVEILQSSIDEKLAWRKAELTRANFLAKTAHIQEDKDYLCRAWLLLMYAHCDKFLKECMELYLTYLQSTNNRQYRADLIWLMIKGQKNLQDKENYKTLNNYTPSREDSFFADTIKHFQGMENFNYYKLRALCDWVMQINYEHDKFHGFCEKLVNVRNKIAHGEKSRTNSLEFCNQFHEDTINLLDSLADKIIETAIAHETVILSL